MSVPVLPSRNPWNLILRTGQLTIQLVQIKLFGVVFLNVVVLFVPTVIIEILVFVIGAVLPVAHPYEFPPSSSTFGIDLFQYEIMS